MRGDEVTTVADALRLIFRAAPAFLEDRANYVEWCRRFDSYKNRVESYLVTVSDDELDALYAKPMSAKQKQMVSYTASVLRLKHPRLANRREAFEWLWAAGANPRYWEASHEN